MKYQNFKVSNFIEIERGLFMNYSLVENMETKILLMWLHNTLDTTESKNNQSGEYGVLIVTS